jgi:hypothetical protein
MTYPRLQVTHTLSKNKTTLGTITKWGFITDNIIYGTFETPYKYLEVNHYYSYGDSMQQIVLLLSEDDKHDSIELQVPNDCTIESINYVALKWTYQIYVIVSSDKSKLNYDLAKKADIATLCDSTYTDEEIEKLNTK